MKDIYRYEFRFTGRVQGVGFRYTAYHAATALGVTGWVTNEWDGSVLMEAQGNGGQIGALLKNLQDGMFIRIDNIEKKQLPVKDDESCFEII